MGTSTSHRAFPMPGAALAAFFAAVTLLAAAASPAFAAADLKKVVRQVFPAAETGFDPAGVQDLYSATIEQAVFETLLTGLAVRYYKAVAS